MSLICSLESLGTKKKKKKRAIHLALSTPPCQLNQTWMQIQEIVTPGETDVDFFATPFLKSYITPFNLWVCPSDSELIGSSFDH